jgi:hypothetical protein
MSKKWKVEKSWYEARLMRDTVSAGRYLKKDDLWCESWSLGEVISQSQDMDVYIVKKEVLVKTKVRSSLIHFMVGAPNGS